MDSVRVDNFRKIKSRYNHVMISTIRHIFQRDELADARPFYVILTALILITCALTLFQSPSPMPVNRLPIFGIVLVLHLGLHWLCGLVIEQRGWLVGYWVLQGVLALGLVIVARAPELALMLFATLVAETLGFLGLTKLAAVAVGGYVVATFGAYYLLGGQPLLADWTSPTFSTMILLILFMLLYRRQTDARQHSQALLLELESAHHQLAEYAAQVESLVLAAERQRMARELHDTLAQGVAGLILGLEAANHHLENGRMPRAQTIVQQSLSRARHTLAAARAAIDDLRLDKRSLPEAIEHQCDRFRRATGIACHVTLDIAAETTISPALAEHAERIISEGLTNVTRHAKAEHVWLHVTSADHNLSIKIKDDGIGFDQQAAIRSGHYGLLGMRERARLVNGEFTLTSAVDAGTTIVVSLPLERV